MIGKVTQNDLSSPVNNIIDNKRLKQVQAGVLHDLKDAIIHSMGPAGSNSLIIRGNDEASIVAEYSKDGNKIIKSIKYAYPIEMAIKSEIENATRHIEKEVGDGTSSVVVMSSLIFDDLNEKYSTNCTNPYEIMRQFSKTVNIVSDKIRSMGRECTIKDIYNITYTSTNGNTELASTITDYYRKYGMNVFIDVSASVNETSNEKEYNGITIEAGYADGAMINNLDRNTARITPNSSDGVRVYWFRDPIDTPEMIAMFKAIVDRNIFSRRSKHILEIPTVIMAPKISKDAESFMRVICQDLNRFEDSVLDQKPKILIITNYLGFNENYAEHICTLCGCKIIKKYIDDKIQQADQESGNAPTLSNVHEFYGTCKEVEANSNTTKFIDPSLMYRKDENGHYVLDENGNRINSAVYNGIINGIENNFRDISNGNGSKAELGSLKRQLNAIKANMIEFFVGGISISDRDSVRDLVEDAVLCCRSAANNGVGYGANTMGLIAINNLIEEYETIPEEVRSKNNKYTLEMLNILKDAYTRFIKFLYGTVYSEEECENILQKIIDNGGIPINISTGEFDEGVLTSIESEPAILSTISKIISIMVSANQAILQAPALTGHY